MPTFKLTREGHFRFCTDAGGLHGDDGTVCYDCGSKAVVAHVLTVERMATNYGIQVCDACLAAYRTANGLARIVGA